MLARIFITSICCWWSVVSVADDCPTDSLEFTKGEDTWCYTIDSKPICIKELQGFEPVTNDYFYCGGSWQSQLPNQHGQHPPNTGQVPPTGTIQIPTQPGDGSTGEGTIRIK